MRASAIAREVSESLRLQLTPFSGVLCLAMHVERRASALETPSYADTEHDFGEDHDTGSAAPSLSATTAA